MQPVMGGAKRGESDRKRAKRGRLEERVEDLQGAISGMADRQAPLRLMPAQMQKRESEPQSVFGVNEWSGRVLAALSSGMHGPIKPGIFQWAKLSGSALRGRA
ncbi:hypothetical protein C1890_17990 [Pseudomonas sp. DP16D-R1]|jgi:hypothetical protein|nr:hypothetical protein C1890_17990 [Pseudomonas sp. DP16D-R1]